MDDREKYETLRLLRRIVMTQHVVATNWLVIKGSIFQNYEGMNKLTCTKNKTQGFASKFELIFEQLW